LSTYVVGDIQGCFYSFLSLLDKIQYSDQDQLWLAGDIINVGANSLEMLQWAYDRRESIEIVPGNHELNFLCCVLEIIEPRDKDTITPILSHPDLEKYVEWLRSLPFIVEKEGFLMSHAGIFPTWTLDEARRYAGKAQAAMSGDLWKKVLKRWKGKFDKKWEPNLKKVKELSTILNIFTRMRYLKEDLKLNKKYKGRVPNAPLDLTPWFKFRDPQAQPMIIFGHWSTLGPNLEHNTYGLDSGCVWGGHLSALRLEDLKLFQVSRDPRDV
jgi:bis(5'-nucleosyl)-tetraphosphatase (symmetrical)